MSNRAPLPPEIARRRTFAIIAHPDAGKNHADRKVPPVRRRDPDGGQVRAKGDARRTGLTS